MRRRLLQAFWMGGIASVLTLASAAWAAVGYQIRTEPQRPIVGQEAVIAVSTTVFGTGADGASPEPLPMPDFPWEFVADAPSGTRHTISLAPTGTSQSEWRGRFTFDEAGEWEVGLHPRHLVAPLDPALGARAGVIVLSSPSGGQDLNLALLAVAAGVIVLAVLGLAILRRRQAHIA